MASILLAVEMNKETVELFIKLLADPSLSEEEFEQFLAEFQARMREEWRKANRPH